METKPLMRPASIAETASRIQKGEPANIAIGEFLDTYYALPVSARPAALDTAPEPVMLPDAVQSRVTDAYLSAMAEALAYTDGFPCPGWAWDQRYFLADPWFGAQSDGMRLLLLRESPVFFRRRNLFVSANVLPRA